MKTTTTLATPVAVTSKIHKPGSAGSSPKRERYEQLVAQIQVEPKFAPSVIAALCEIEDKRLFSEDSIGIVTIRSFFSNRMNWGWDDGKRCLTLMESWRANKQAENVVPTVDPTATAIAGPTATPCSERSPSAGCDPAVEEEKRCDRPGSESGPQPGESREEGANSDLSSEAIDAYPLPKIPASVRAMKPKPRTPEEIAAINGSDGDHNQLPPPRRPCTKLSTHAERTKVYKDTISDNSGADSNTTNSKAPVGTSARHTLNRGRANTAEPTPTKMAEAASEASPATVFEPQTGIMPERLAEVAPNPMETRPVVAISIIASNDAVDSHADTKPNQQEVDYTDGRPGTAPSQSSSVEAQSGIAPPSTEPNLNPDEDTCTNSDAPPTRTTGGAIYKALVPQKPESGASEVALAVLSSSSGLAAEMTTQVEAEGNHIETVTDSQVMTTQQTRDHQTDYWVERINQTVKKCATACIDIGCELNAAKAKLEHGEWTQMFESGAVKLSLRVAQRLMKIADHPILVKTTNSSFLPASPDALYALCKLPPETLETGIKNGTIHPAITIANAKKLAEQSTDYQIGKPVTKEASTEVGTDCEQRWKCILRFLDDELAKSSPSIRGPLLQKLKSYADEQALALKV